MAALSLALSLKKMADGKESHEMKRTEIKPNSLLGAILPVSGVCGVLEIQNDMMATYFVASNHWRSLLIIGQSQVQRNGLLFQASISC